MVPSTIMSWPYLSKAAQNFLQCLPHADPDMGTLSDVHGDVPIHLMRIGESQGEYFLRTKVHFICTTAVYRTSTQLSVEVKDKASSIISISPSRRPPIVSLKNKQLKEHLKLEFLH